MFNPKTEKIKILSEQFTRVIEELEQIFDAPANIYIDFANVLGWQDQLKWHIDIKRLKQFLDSFENIKKVKFYYGTLAGDRNSELLIKQAAQYAYEVKTKPVKILKLSIDTSSIAIDSQSLLENFIRKSLLGRFDLKTIKFLNKKLKNLNKRGIYFIEDRKCNFDVEIGRGMLRDYDKNNINNFILWSGDSDFAEPVAQQIRNFICWNKEMQKGSLERPLSYRI